MSWTFAEERPIYWEEPPEQIAITNVETGEHDFYMLTSAATKRIRELKEYVSLLEARLGRGECENISDPPEGFLCSSCGWGDFAEPSHLLTTAKFTDNERGPNYCPNCGKKVADDCR